MSLHHMLRAAAGNAGPSDPYFEYNTLLLTGNGTNGAQNNTFLDSSTNNFTITRNGNTTQGTFSPYGNLWSNYFDGSGDWLNNTTLSSAFAFGTGDFVMECFAYPVSTSGTFKGVISTYDATSQPSAPILEIYNGYWSFYTPSLGHRQSAAAVALNTWTHVALVRSSGVFTLYVNGTSVDSATDTANFTNSPFQVGAIGNSSSYTFNGYISNVRIVKGTAVYTSNFTPSTTPLTAVSGTSLLTCQSNRFIDNSSNNFTLTVNGNTSVQRFSPFNPTAPYSASTIGGSGYFDGTGDYLVAGGTINIGSGDYTVEAWVYMNSLPTYSMICGYGSQSYIGIRPTAVAFGNSSGATYPEWNFTFSIGVWYHIAIVKQSNTLKAFVNGNQLTLSSGSATSSSSFCSGQLLIGRYNGSPTYDLNGYISNFRVVNSTAVYTANFTPPTAPLTAITNTSLLLNFTNAGIPDAAMMNDLETVGNAQVSTSVKKYGTGSLAFDGSGDWLYAVANPVFGFGTGDATIEGWIYPSTVSGTQVFVDMRNGSSDGIALYLNGTTLSVAKNTSTVLQSGGTVSANTWQHIAWSRSGTSNRLFLNGTLVSTVTDSTNYPTTFVYIGYASNGTQPFAGYIDDLRITKGYARYTANFTPPAQALPTY